MDAPSACFCTVRSFTLRLLVLCLAASIFPMAATAAEINVDCDIGESLQAAIDSLDPVGPNTITVSGTCQEFVGIGDWGNVAYQGLMIRGPAGGGTATITPPPAYQGRGWIITIAGSHAIWLDRLVLRGGEIGLVVGDQSEVDTSSVTIEDNESIGAFVEGTSVLFLVGATIRNNGRFGVYTPSTQTATVHFYGDSTTPTVVEGHSVCGICLRFASTATLGGPVQVRNNGSAGDDQSAGVYLARNSALHLVEFQPDGRPEISGNTGPGILAEVGSTVSLGGAAIANNTGAGIRVEGLSVAQIELPSSFSANGTFALSCDVSSWAVGNLTGVVPLDCKNVETKPGKIKTGAAASSIEVRKPLKRH